MEEKSYCIPIFFWQRNEHFGCILLQSRYSQSKWPKQNSHSGQKNYSGILCHNSFDQMNTGTASWMGTLFGTGILFRALRLTVMFDLNAYKWHMTFFMKYKKYYAAHHKHTDTRLMSICFVIFLFFSQVSFSAQRKKKWQCQVEKERNLILCHKVPSITSSRSKRIEKKGRWKNL